MDKRTIFVGLDVHKESIAVGVVDGDPQGRFLGAIANTPQAILKMMRKLGAFEHLSVCYEAGPCGYVIYRQLAKLGIECVVVAPSLVPRKPGDRVKTDRRDALKLAQMLRNQSLTAIWVPDESHEALRDLSRAVEAAQGDLVRARHRIRKLLLRQGMRPPEGIRPWTYRHREWLDRVSFSYPSQQVTFREMLLTLDQARERRKRLEAELAHEAGQSPLAGLIQAWQCMRGIKVHSAARLAAELGDIRRFTNPRQLMGYVGLIPSEHSSGERVRRGSVTKSGNAHVRHLLVQAAWHSRHAPSTSKALQKRQRGQPERVIAIAWKAQDRLHRRFRRLVGRGKPPQKAVVAVAREMLGFLWAIAQEVELEAESVTQSSKQMAA